MLLTYESVTADGAELNTAESIRELLNSDSADTSSGDVIIVVFTKSWNSDWKIVLSGRYVDEI